jgi:hypothetical protein
MGHQISGQNWFVDKTKRLQQIAFEIVVIQAVEDHAPGPFVFPKQLRYQQHMGGADVRRGQRQIAEGQEQDPESSATKKTHHKII